MKLGTIELHQDGSALVITFANGKANVISRKMIEEINEVLDDAVLAPEVGEIVITGKGDRFFSAGADINEIAEFVLAGEGGRKPMTREERMQAGYEFSKRGQNLVLRLRHFPKPVTALINGMAFGGGFELALGCQKRVATPNALMALPEVTLGIIPGWGGTWTLADILGTRDATMLIRKGQMISSYVAFNADIVENFSDYPNTALPQIPQRTPAPNAASMVERFVFQQSGLDEEEAFEREANYFADLCVLPEAQEGIRAFLEKREPNFEKL